MPAIETVVTRMAGYGDRPAVRFKSTELTYTQFLAVVDHWCSRLSELGVGAGSVVAVVGDFSPTSCALFFALMLQRAIAVPFTSSTAAAREDLMRIAGVEMVIAIDADENVDVQTVPNAIPNDLIATFRTQRLPGLVVFTSGSTGAPKGILHNCENVMKKFVTERRGWRSILFLLMDHFGGFNTFLGAFAYGGVAMCVPSRNPAAVCEAIQAGRATLLPTTPTFINLLIASNAHRSYDLSSVELITYGTEVMPELTLKKAQAIFPKAQIKQTYGLSELGVLRSKSSGDDSVWVKLGGAGFETRVVDDILWVRSEANMVGYLNAPSPFDDAGWMCTGDQVEVREDYMRIIGRRSDMINVGGQKVFPAEVEAALLEASNVLEATAFGVPHPIMGNVVHARLTLEQPEPPGALTERMRAHCAARLEKYKIPLRFAVVEADAQRSERFKKVRSIRTGPNV